MLRMRTTGPLPWVYWPSLPSSVAQARCGRRAGAADARAGGAVTCVGESMKNRAKVSAAGGSKQYSLPSCLRLTVGAQVGRLNAPQAVGQAGQRQIVVDQTRVRAWDPGLVVARQSGVRGRGRDVSCRQLVRRQPNCSPSGCWGCWRAVNTRSCAAVSPSAEPRMRCRMPKRACSSSPP